MIASPISAFSKYKNGQSKILKQARSESPALSIIHKK